MVSRMCIACTQSFTQILIELKERVRLEQEYAQGLKKLTKRSPPDSSSDLGSADRRHTLRP